MKTKDYSEEPAFETCCCILEQFLDPDLGQKSFVNMFLFVAEKMGMVDLFYPKNPDSSLE